MLTQQFFTRVQLAKILDFKSDGSIKDLEKKGFITPQVKPSKYTFNQVLFMMICKELTDFRNFSWKKFIDCKLNFTLEYNLIDYDALLIYNFIYTDRMGFLPINSDDLVRRMNFFLNNEVSNILLKLKESVNNTSESNTSVDLPNFYIFCDTDCDVYTFPIDRIYLKLQNKCIELKIDLNEKIRA